MFTQELINAWYSVEPAKTQEFTELPEGKYIATIDAIKLNAPKQSGDKTIPEMLCYQMTVQDGELAGTKFRKEDGIWTEKSLAFIKRDILTLGCTIPRELADVPVALQNAVGATVEVEVVKTSKNGKEYTNTYIRRLVNRMAAPSESLQSQTARYSQVVNQRTQAAGSSNWADRYDDSCPF